jgi:hypothetical protein
VHPQQAVAALTVVAALGAPPVVVGAQQMGAALGVGIPAWEYGLAALAITGLLSALRAALKTIEHLSQRRRARSDAPPPDSKEP